MKEDWVAKMLRQANTMAYCYEFLMVNATAEEINRSLEDPERAEIILYLSNLLK
jgi:hypothetical protein